MSTLFLFFPYSVELCRKSFYNYIKQIVIGETTKLVLEEYRRIYEEKANILGDWKSINKNELCNLYIEVEKTNPRLAESYFSAIMCKYWPAIDKYHSQSYLAATPEDCYGWLITSVMYALEHRSWLDPSKDIYNDPNGPDKVINKVMKSERLTFYQSINRDKRKLNYNMISLEKLEEDSGMLTHSSDNHLFSTDIIDKEIVSAFRKKDYFLAILIDLISYNDVLLSTLTEDLFAVNENKLIKKLHSLDQSYITYFTNKYKLDKDIVTQAVEIVSALSAKGVKQRIHYNLTLLKHSGWVTTLRNAN